MARIKIPVCELEFEEGGDTIWVHSPLGATVLRIKAIDRITTVNCDTNPVSHLDLVVPEAEFCLAGDAERNG